LDGLRASVFERFGVMKKLTLGLVIEREDDPAAGYSVSSPDLPGCFSNGGTVAEARANMREAVELFWKAWLRTGKRFPSVPVRKIVNRIS
jgi:predicted RNase H-like HicB family nuclease